MNEWLIGLDIKWRGKSTNQRHINQGIYRVKLDFYKSTKFLLLQDFIVEVVDKMTKWWQDLMNTHKGNHIGVRQVIVSDKDL